MKTAHGPIKNFVIVNCTTLPENLIENTLFGHDKGAFTGANKVRKGLIEQAHVGTLFFDEIGELPFDMLSQIVGGATNGNGNSRSNGNHHYATKFTGSASTHRVSRHRAIGASVGAAPKTKIYNPNDRIPLDDGEFEFNT